MRYRFCLALGLCFIAAPSLGAKDKDQHEKSAKHEKHPKRSAIPPYDDEPWACVKNGKIIEVKGKGKRQKQDRCEAQFGIWEKKRHALEETGGKK